MIAVSQRSTAASISERATHSPGTERLELSRNRIGSQAPKMPQARAPATLLTTEVQIGGRPQRATGQLTPQRLIHADALAAAAHSRNGSVITPPSSHLGASRESPPLYAGRGAAHQGSPPACCGRLLKRFVSAPARTHQRRFNDRAWQPPDIGELGHRTTRTCARYRTREIPDCRSRSSPVAVGLRAGNEWNVIRACTIPTGARGVDGRSRWPSQRSA